jgi:hypothetical protein
MSEPARLQQRLQRSVHLGGCVGAIGQRRP